MPKDPICGMEVDPKTAKYKIYQVQGKRKVVHYFCSKQCRDQFEEREEKKKQKPVDYGLENVKKKPATGSGMYHRESIKITKMHCVNCAQTIERELRKVPGVAKANVNYASEKAIVKHNTTTEKLVEAIKKAGYDVETKKSKEQNYGKRLMWAIIFAVPLLVFSMGMHVGLKFPLVLEDNRALIELLLTTPILILGYEFFTRGIIAFFRTWSANMDTLVALGTGTAYVYSTVLAVQTWFFARPDGGYYFATAGLLLTFILLGKYFENRTKGKTSAALKELVKLQPQTAVVERDGEEYKIPVSEIEVGDIVIVGPGGKVPVDGVVISGESSVNESIVTGESMPVAKSEGSQVIGGTINKTGSLKFKAEKIGSDTFLSNVIRLVEEAQGSKAPIEKMTDKVAAWFVPGVVFLAISSFLVWYLIIGAELSFALVVLVSVLVIACPCALGLATPTAVMMGTGIAARRGILIKSAEALQKVKDIGIIVFDKTGTLTKGQPELTNWIGVGEFPKDGVLQYAAIVERRSEHPLAEAIVSVAKKEKMTMPEVQNFKSYPGLGVSGDHNGKHILLGNKKLFEQKEISLAAGQDNIDYYEKKGKTLMLLAVDKKFSGILAAEDQLKDWSVDAIRVLKEQGKKIVLLTGDNQKTADSIADKLEINKAIAEVLPKEKLEEIKKLQKGQKVAMVGDGVNDAPALAASDLGIALGAGTDVALESADIVLVHDDLRDVSRAFDISEYTIKKIKQNLFWAFAYNVLAIPIAMGILYPVTGWLLSPIIAGGAMAFSSVFVTTNSLLMKN